MHVDVFIIDVIAADAAGDTNFTDDFLEMMQHVSPNKKTNIIIVPTTTMYRAFRDNFKLIHILSIVITKNFQWWCFYVKNFMYEMLKTIPIKRKLQFDSFFYFPFGYETFEHD